MKMPHQKLLAKLIVICAASTAILGKQMISQVVYCLSNLKLYKYITEVAGDSAAKMTITDHGLTVLGSKFETVLNNITVGSKIKPFNITNQDRIKYNFLILSGIVNSFTCKSAAFSNRCCSHFHIKIATFRENMSLSL